MSTPASRSSEAPPPSSHDELSQQLRDLNLVVKPNIDDRTARILSDLIRRIHPDPNFIHHLDVTLAGSKSRESPSNGKHHLDDALASNKFWGSSNGGDDRATVTPTPTNPCLNKIETRLDSEAGDQFSAEGSNRQMPEIDRICTGRFSYKPIRVMVNNTEFFVHERMLRAMFSNLSTRLGRDHTLYVSDIPEYVFEAAVEYEYSRSIETLEKLHDEDLELLGDFARDYDNTPLLAAICQIKGVELFDKHSLWYIGCMHEDCSEYPGFKDYFRESLRKELLKRLEDGGSCDFISGLVDEFQGKVNVMEDVSMVLHELWSASTTRAKSLEAELAARGNVGSGSDNIDGSGWGKSANDFAWPRDGNQNDLQPSSGRQDDAGTGWETIIKTSWNPKLSTAYHAASGPDPPTSTCPPPPAPANPPTQSNWGNANWRPLNTPSFVPESPPITARGSPDLLHKASALGRCIHHWMNRQRAENCCRKSFTVQEVATSVGCTEFEADTALAELVDAGFVLKTVESWTGQTLYRALLSKTTSLPGWEVNQDLY